MCKILNVENDKDISKCYPVMKVLREGYTEQQFLSQVNRQRKGGYIISYAQLDDEVFAVAGWRIRDNLAMKKHLYIEDLVSREDKRSMGYGTKLLDYVLNIARESQCNAILLDSGVQRYSSHRFYIRNYFEIRAHLFAKILK
jgi:GNAT superfamily N-acetyltransferase